MSPALPDEYPVACEWLFPGEPAKAAKALALVQAGEFGPDALFVARDGAQVVGAVLVHLQCGSSGTVYPPGAINAATADALGRTAVVRLAEADVKQAQTLLRPAEAAKAEPLVRAGFVRIARLSLQIRTIELLEIVDPPTKSLRFTVATAQTPGFAETLEATYDGTLDCPELNGLREIREVLKGYHQFPNGEAPGWFLVKEANEPIGVVLLGPGPRDGIVELSYLGLVPSARGRRLGRELLRFALREAAHRFAECIILNVDERNGPALQLYDKQDFRQYDQQDVFLWTGPR